MNTRLIQSLLSTAAITTAATRGDSMNGGAHEAAGGTIEARAVTAAIKKIVEEYSSSFVAGDADRWFALWDDTGVQLPPNAPMIVGKAAIEQEYRPLIAPGAVKSMHINVQEVQTAGDLAFARGTYTLQMGPQAGDTFIDGKFLTVFKRGSDGSWRILRDCFNSNVPAA